jgi:predicted NAD/FAD-dependent oxidoreductase
VLRNLSGAAPAWFTVKRWPYARPAHARPEAFSFDGVVGRAGDSWAGQPRTQSAWVSGDALGREMSVLLG